MRIPVDSFVQIGEHMIIYPIFLLAILMSCGFSESSDDSNSFPEDMHHERLLPPLIAEEDHDGDFLTNEEEARLGTNPRVADLPDVRTRFIQNYKIQVDYKNLSNGEIGSFDIIVLLVVGDGVLNCFTGCWGVVEMSLF